MNYSYDSLNRLVLAQTTSSLWGQSFSYDGFGNLTSEQATQGTAYSANFNYDATTNRITTAGYQYDANGNLTAMPNAGMSYDIENRLAQATQTVNGTEFYGYGLGNRRVWKQLAGGSQEVYFYGPGGEKLGTYAVMSSGYFLLLEKKTDVYFRQQLIWEGPLASGTGAGGALVLDRLGTAVVKDGQKYAYFPYGEPRVGAGDHFATYQRDATTGFDYALNRYYSNVAGRFLTPDPYRGSARRSNPQSWNRYEYAGDDPVNFNDPTGLVNWWQVAKGVGQAGSGFLLGLVTAGANIGTSGLAVLPTIGATMTAASLIGIGSYNFAAGLADNIPAQNSAQAEQQFGTLTNPIGAMATFGAYLFGASDPVQIGQFAAAAYDITANIPTLLTPGSSTSSLINGIVSVNQG